MLRTYWQQHKSDEDALRPMLELLGEQERYQEAEEYYQQFLCALAELNPAEDEKLREPDTRTRDVREYLRTKQIRRQSEMRQSTSPSHAISLQDERYIPFSQEIKQGIIDAMCELLGNDVNDLRSLTGGL